MRVTSTSSGKKRKRPDMVGDVMRSTADARRSPPLRSDGPDAHAAAFARSRAARVIARVIEIYGASRWRSQHGDIDPLEAWTVGTADLSSDEIKRGLRACMASGETWPPSLPVFRSWCRPGGRFMSRDVATSGFALPHKLTDEERARGRRGVAEARAVLAGRSVDRGA